MAHEVAGGGADGIGGDDRQSLVHGFVDDEPPRLAEGSGAQRRYDQNVPAPVEVADLRAIRRPHETHRPGGPGPGSLRTGAYQDERGAWFVETRQLPGLDQRSMALFPVQSAAKHALKLGVPGALDGRAPEVVVHRLWGHDHVARTARGHVLADVGAVRRDRVGPAVDPPQGQRARDPRERARLGPQGRPQHEGDTRAPGAAVGAREGDPPGRAAYDGAEVAGGGEGANVALGDAAVGKGEVGGAGLRGGGRVVRAAAEQREHHPLALVQQLERAHARGRRVVGHEQHRLQRTASS